MKFNNQITEQVLCQFDDKVWALIYDKFNNQICYQISRQTGNQVSNRIGNQVWEILNEI